MLVANYLTNLVGVSRVARESRFYKNLVLLLNYTPNELLLVTFNHANLCHKPQIYTGLVRKYCSYKEIHFVAQGSVASFDINLSLCATLYHESGILSNNARKTP